VWLELLEAYHHHRNWFDEAKNVGSEQREELLVIFFAIEVQVDILYRLRKCAVFQWLDYISRCHLQES